MKTIHKFVFMAKGLEIMLEPSAKPRFVAPDWSTDRPAIWIEREATDIIEEFPVRTQFEIYGTGQPIPDGATYVGSLIQQIYVLHIYQLIVKHYTEAELQEMGDL